MDPKNWLALVVFGISGSALADPDCGGVADRVLRDAGFAKGAVADLRKEGSAVSLLRDEFKLRKNATDFDALVRLELAQPGLEKLTGEALAKKQVAAARSVIAKFAATSYGSPVPADASDAKILEYLRNPPARKDVAFDRQFSWFLPDGAEGTEEIRAFRKSAAGEETEVVVYADKTKVTKVVVRLARGGFYDPPHLVAEVDPKSCALASFSTVYDPKPGRRGPAFEATAGACAAILGLAPAETKDAKKLIGVVFAGDEFLRESMLEDLEGDPKGTAAGVKALYEFRKKACTTWAADLPDPEGKLKPFLRKIGDPKPSGGGSGGRKAGGAG